jgi:hypothetical protein
MAKALAEEAAEQHLPPERKTAIELHMLDPDSFQP